MNETMPVNLDGAKCCSAAAATCSAVTSAIRDGWSRSHS